MPLLSQHGRMAKGPATATNNYLNTQSSLVFDIGSGSCLPAARGEVGPTAAPAVDDSSRTNISRQRPSRGSDPADSVDSQNDPPSLAAPLNVLPDISALRCISANVQRSRSNANLVLERHRDAPGRGLPAVYSHIPRLRATSRA